MRRESEEKVKRAMRDAKRGHRWWRMACPFCEELGHRDRKLSCGINPSSGIVRCFRCGFAGRLREAPEPRSVWEEGQDEQEDVQAMAPPEGYVPLGEEPGLSALSLAEPRAYVAGRGVDAPLARRLGIGACDEGWWSGRVIVPILMPESDEWLGWVGRLWRNPSPRAEGVAGMKYLYPKGMPRGLYLYNHDALLEKTDEPLLVVEGVFDTFRFWPDAAAVLGKPSALQVEALAAARRPVVAVLDGDAWCEGHALAMQLQMAGQRAGSLRLPPRKDPDELPVDELRAAARKAVGRADPVKV